MAIGGGLTRFVAFSHNPHRFFAGGILDLSWGGAVAESSEYPEDLWESDATTLALVSNAGYRFRFPSGFFTGVGGFLGAGFELKDEYVHTGPRRYDTKTHQAEKNIIPFLMLEASIGWEL
jgi:hypothetical protein